MTFIAFILVLVSAFLHAGWNFLSKRHVPSLAYYMISSITAMVSWCPFYFFSDFSLGTLPAEFWLLFVVSVGFETIYVFGLTHAYRNADISLVYPLARAVPVLMVAILTIIFGLGKTPSLAALAGMAILSFGCLLMPLRRWQGFRFSSYRSGSLKFILLAATGCTGYTLIDSIAVRIIKEFDSSWLSSIIYLFMIEAGLSLAMAVSVCFSRMERQSVSGLLKKPLIPMVSGVFSSSAYVLILFAMLHVDNVSYIQAFRQMSLPLAVFAGVFWLHEKPGKPRITGIALVILGLVIISIS